MARVQQRPATYADLERLPEHVIGEILDGELIVSPRSASPHAYSSSILGADLINPFARARGGPGGPGGWWILDEPELHLHDDVVVPDLAGWRRERMPAFPRTAAFELAPDWVCEVISPSTARHDRTRKLRIYARERVSFAWLVDPLARTLEVLQRTDEMWTLLRALADDEQVRAAPFDEVELDLARWWIPDEDAGP